MRKAKHKMLTEFRWHWKNYVFQSLLATFLFFLTFLALGMNESVMIASVGATTFIVFAMPKNAVAGTRNIIGGHVVGLGCGLLCTVFLRRVTFDHRVAIPMAYSLAVGCSVFIMVVTDTEHPPASGTALGMAMQGPSLRVVVNLLIIVVILALIHHFFKRHLRDLT